jgi:hypothetical protein
MKMPEYIIGEVYHCNCGPECILEGVLTRVDDEDCGVISTRRGNESIALSLLVMGTRNNPVVPKRKLKGYAKWIRSVESA